MREYAMVSTKNASIKSFGCFFPKGVGALIPILSGYVSIVKRRLFQEARVPELHDSYLRGQSPSRYCAVRPTRDNPAHPSGKDDRATGKPADYRL